jgi:hypothetical protein
MVLNLTSTDEWERGRFIPKEQVNAAVLCVRMIPWSLVQIVALCSKRGLDGVIDSLLFAQHAIEMFRRSLPDSVAKHRLDQLANRLTKILAETRKLNSAG